MCEKESDHNFMHKKLSGFLWQFKMQCINTNAYLFKISPQNSIKSAQMIQTDRVTISPYILISVDTVNPKALRKKFIWKCRLLKLSAANNCQHYWQIKYRSKQRGPRTDCSYRSSLIWVHTVCHRGFLNISADEKSRRLLLRLAH